MADVFGGYGEAASGVGAWDEMFERVDSVRPPYAELHASLQRLSISELATRKQLLDRSFVQAGITYDFDGSERAWPLDLVPRLIDASEWSVIEAGVSQRVRALEAFLSDVYGAQQILRDGVVPGEVVLGSRYYQPAAVGWLPPGRVRIHVAGIDLVRDAAGRLLVLEDNVRVPSGVSYVIENRHAMTKVLGEVFASHRVHPVADYPDRLLDALRACAPGGVDTPVVVLLTPGVYNSAYFEHALLARQMGVELVEGRDLVVREGRVHMRTARGLVGVDVIYRRVDDDWLDPDQFRPDSLLGCRGLFEVARAGRVTLANAVGNGVADDKLVCSYVPSMIEYYLGQRPVLDTVDTLRMADPDQRQHALSRLAELVVKPVDGSGGAGIVIGPLADDRTLDQTRAQILANPRGYIAQPVVQLSTAPTLVGDRLAPRHLDLRPFAINDGATVRVLPGGLTRVALADGGLIVNSSQGGGSKDTWVLAPSATRPGEVVAWTRPGPRLEQDSGLSGAVVLSRVAEALYWTGRYLGRFEHTARILDVHVQRLLDDPYLDASQADHALLEALDLTVPGIATGSRSVAEALSFDADNPASLIGALAAARESARGARDVLSSEVWDALNTTWIELPQHADLARALGMHGLFRYARQRAALLDGLVHATLADDDSRRFLDMGWNIERIDLTARLLLSRHDDPHHHSSWTSILRACGAYEIFQRLYRRPADPASVAVFLVQDVRYPRSIHAALTTIGGLLDPLDPPGNDHGPRPARRIVAAALARVHGVDLHDVGHLHTVAADVTRVGDRLHYALHTQYFT